MRKRREKDKNTTPRRKEAKAQRGKTILTKGKRSKFDEEFFAGHDDLAVDALKGVSTKRR